MGLFSRKTDDAERQDILLRRKQARQKGVFVSRANIFEYMIFEEGMSREEAEKEAESWARNLGLPDSVEPKKTGIPAFVDQFKQISVVIKENPEAAEWLKPLITGAGTALISGLAGAFIANNSQEHHNPEPVYDPTPITPKRL